MNLKNGKVAASIPVTVLWPGVTIPEHHVFINGCEQLMICWGDSTSINDGNIQSYIVCLIRFFFRIGFNIFVVLFNSFICSIQNNVCYIKSVLIRPIVDKFG